MVWTNFMDSEIKNLIFTPKFARKNNNNEKHYFFAKSVTINPRFGQIVGKGIFHRLYGLDFLFLYIYNLWPKFDHLLQYHFWDFGQLFWYSNRHFEVKMQNCQNCQNLSLSQKTKNGQNFAYFGP